MRIVEKENELNLYLSEWADAHLDDWQTVYQGVYRERQYEIYRVEDGNRILDYFYSVKCNLEDFISVGDKEHVIPTCKSSVSAMMDSMQLLLNYINEGLPLVEKHLKGEDTRYFIAHIYQLIMEAREMLMRCLRVYNIGDDLPEPYLEIKEALRLDQIDVFLEKLSSVIAGVSYGIHKTNFDEGHFHTMVHVILTMLGFFPCSEVMTNKGRIDMTIKIGDSVYLFEFKYSSKGTNLSKRALKQIKDNKYAEKYKLEVNKIIGVGVSFSGITRNIGQYIREDLFEKQIPKLSTRSAE